MRSIELSFPMTVSDR